MASVLVVDDQQTNRELLAMVVGSAGHRVLEAGGGEQGLAIAREERPDLVIADILMPAMDGFEFARRLRSDPDVGATRIVFCTASYVRDEMQQLARGCGVEHFLIKPCEPEQILALVAKMLETDAASAASPVSKSFDREHAQVVNNRLLAKVIELEQLNARFEEVNDALQASERQFRLLFEHNPQPMMVYEQSTLAIVAVNDALANGYGYDKDELLQMSLADLVPEDDRERLSAFLAANPAEGRIRHTSGFDGQPWRHVHRDGKIVEIEAASDGMLIDGAACRVVAFTDVTERNRATAERNRAMAERMAMADELANELRSQNERLREVDKLKDQFVSVVSHELRTPLTAIRGYLEILRGGEPGALTDEQRRCLEIVDLSCRQLLRVVGDLLLIGKSEAGQLMLEMGDVDLASLVEDAIVAAQPSADAKQIGLSAQTESDIGSISADAGRLSQAIGNVISNAIKFTHEGHVEVRLYSTKRRNGTGAAARGHAIVEIVDTGGGVPESEVEHLFVPFFRATTATEHAIPGSGLGLSIAKEIIEAHGGTISLESEIGAGTSVRIELPIGGTA